MCGWKGECVDGLGPPPDVGVDGGLTKSRSFSRYIVESVPRMFNSFGVHAHSTHESKFISRKKFKTLSFNRTLNSSESTSA